MLSNLEGTQIGDYSILERIHEGFFSHVYTVSSPDFAGLPLVMKVPTSEIAGQRLRLEHSFLTSGVAEGIPRVVDARFDEHLNYIVMINAGESLESVLKQGALDPDRALRIATQVLVTLGEAHAEGIIHRDVKPGNILLKDDETTLIDWNLLKKRIVPGLESSLLSGEGEQVSKVAGSVWYSAPESLGASVGGTVHEVCPATDTYSVGACLYNMLTGDPPATGVRAPSLVNKGSPPDLDALVMNACNPDIGNRFQSTIEMMDALELVDLSNQATVQDVQKRDQHVPQLLPSVSYLTTKGKEIMSSVGKGIGRIRDTATIKVPINTALYSVGTSLVIAFTCLLMATTSITPKKSYERDGTSRKEPAFPVDISTPPVASNPELIPATASPLHLMERIYMLPKFVNDLQNHPGKIVYLSHETKTYPNGMEYKVRTIRVHTLGNIRESRSHRFRQWGECETAMHPDASKVYILKKSLLKNQRRPRPGGASSFWTYDLNTSENDLLSGGWNNVKNLRITNGVHPLLVFDWEGEPYAINPKTQDYFPFHARIPDQQNSLPNDVTLASRKGRIMLEKGNQTFVLGQGEFPCFASGNISVAYTNNKEK